MADTTTTNLSLTKPEVGASADTWGGKLNTNLDTIDGIFAAAGNGTSVGLNVGTGKTLTVGGTQNMSALTASTALALDASKNIVSVTNTGTGNNVLSASPTFTGTISGAAASLSGNLTFSSTSQRITGDMSNATEANRLFFQTSTTNGATRLGVIPNGTQTAAAVDVFNNSDPTNASFTRLRTSSTESQVQAAITGTGTYLPMTFLTGGSERMRLDTSGNLGIGTASPGYKLHVVGAVYASDSINTTGALYSNDGTTISRIISSGGISYWGTTTNHPVVYQTNNTERMRIDSSGNVGIGVTPAYQFEVKTANDAILRVVNSGATQISLIQSTNLARSAYAPLSIGGSYTVLETGGSERMRIDSSGNVGIGTASPSGRLDAEGSSGATYFNFSATAGGAASVFSLLGGTASEQAICFNSGALRFGTVTGKNAAGFTERMRIDSSGNVGIGTTSLGGFFGTVNLGGSGNPGSGFLEGWMNSQSIPSSVTTRFDGFISIATTAAASFTLTGLRHFTAQGATKGAGSTITSQFGFYVDNTLTGATNNFGFYSDIASGSNRWNFYANGTAGNYFAGNISVGSTSRGNALVTANSDIAIEVRHAGTPYYQWYNSAAATDKKYWRMGNSGGDLSIETVNDAYSSATARFVITSTGNTVAGQQLALATTATDGFLYVPTCAGTPTGTPTAITGMAPIVVNTTNNKLYFYSGGAWRDAGP